MLTIGYRGAARRAGDAEVKAMVTDNPIALRPIVDDIL
jgi:hypothetical protein